LAAVAGATNKMKLIIYLGILSGLLSFFSCDNSKQSKIIATTDSGKDTTINVNDILFSIPTIENTFPNFEGEVDSTGLSILEDDWRQIEFISKDQMSSINTEIDSINYIFDQKSHKGPTYIGFKDIYVRKLIKAPLFIPMSTIITYLGDPDSKISGLNVFNNVGKVKNGFSFINKGVKYYGVKDNANNVTSLCLYEAESDEFLSRSIEKISKFLKSQNLLLVHWTHAKVFNENNIQELVSDLGSR